MSDTPRTDAVLNTFNGVASKLAADLATHAEILERELAANLKGTELIARMLADERALSDRLAGELHHIAAWRDAAIANCHYNPVPLADWKESRHE